MTGSPIWVTADDYGLTPAVNRGITQLVSSGAITAVSVMMHAGAHLEQLASLAALRPTLGLHLVFVEEAPLGPSSRLGGLLDRDGRFPSYPRLFGRLLANPALATLLRDEAEAQLDRYRASGLPLQFINSHQHVHLFPPLWR